MNESLNFRHKFLGEYHETFETDLYSLVRNKEVIIQFSELRVFDHPLLQFNDFVAKLCTIVINMRENRIVVRR